MNTNYVYYGYRTPINRCFVFKLYKQFKGAAWHVFFKIFESGIPPLIDEIRNWVISVAVSTAKTNFMPHKKKYSYYFFMCKIIHIGTHSFLLEQCFGVIAGIIWYIKKKILIKKMNIYVNISRQGRIWGGWGP